MITKRFIFDHTVQLTKKFFEYLPARSKTCVLAEFAEQIIPVQTQQTPVGEIQFYSFGVLPDWRAETLLTKEPETLEWIDNFEKGSVFWDVGANVGCYSLYAGKKDGITVWAFEPSSLNYYILNQNIFLNHLDKQISALCIAFSDQGGVGYLNMSDMKPGSAFNSFGEAENSMQGANLTLSNVQFHQCMLGFSMDEFCAKYSVSTPNYLKIDVDGLEPQILDGAQQILSSPAFKSLLVEFECDSPQYPSIIQKLESFGLKLVKQGKAPVINSKVINIRNHIFSKVSQ
ncbi:MAG: FkbM family methyltransferase [SAR324 cluster bacterium]|nr:FkbM family methyltransferase [SAR324 cluster bacterium]